MDLNVEHSDFKFVFTIFLPVHNGGKYFKKCVLSILEQTYKQFELVILENQSSDGSYEWVSSLQDSRIRIYKSMRKLSIEENWGRILDISKNEFMTIIGHDDLFDPNYLVVMCQLIAEHPQATLYHTHFRLINVAGKTIRHCLPMPAEEKVDSFLLARLKFRRDSFGTGYMFRSRDYIKVGGIPSYKKLMYADDALWLSLMRGSYKATSTLECFSYRVHSQSISYLPDWKSLYVALNCFLDFLLEIAEGSVEIKVVLKKALCQYVIFWYQWIYFSCKTSEEQKEITLNIWKSVSKVSTMLKKLNVKDADCFNFKVRKLVFSYFSRYYWFGTRLYRWILNRLITLI